MQGGEDQVTGEGGLDGDFGHFQVANFADEDDVGRLTQHGAKNLGEGQADLLFDLALVDADEVVFDGVFGGDDFFVGAIELVKGGVERGGFAGAGGAGHQEDAVGALDDALEDLVVLFLEAQILDADADGIGTQNTKHDGLAVITGQSADAEVDVVLIDGKLDAAVLGKALFSNVDAGHDLQALNQGALHAEGDAVALDAFAVDAMA